jgi:hypothetical protein
MPERERSDAGTFVEKVTLDAVRGVFGEVRGPVITSSDVADQLNCTTEAARQKLTRLYDRGEVDKRKTGRTVVYWRTGGERITPDERANQEHAEKARERDVARSTDHADQSPANPSDPGETAASAQDIEQAIQAVDTPGSGETKQDREQALRRAYAYLQEHGEAQRKDFKDLLGDDVGYASFNSWWNNYVKAKDALKQLPNVDAPGEGEHTWRYAGNSVEEPSVYDPTEEF